MPITPATLLAKPIAGQQLVVTEGIFSMDGDSAPLRTLAAAARHAHAWLMVDDAHGTGVVGEQGRGSCHVHGITPEILIVTFGKGFGVSGAAVLCSDSVADYLLQFARHLIYSTSMPPARCDGAERRIAGDPQPGRGPSSTTPAALIARFRHGVAQLGMDVTDSQSAIQPLIVGENARALRPG